MAEVIHEAALHRFHVVRPEGEGKLLYREAGPGVLEYWHTEVDPGLRGQGVADQLAQAAFDYARGASLKVIPSCPFVQTWLKRHPAERDLVVAR
ncbi:MAG: GNAT family N-acetyltransferase [Gemmatimonadales bacterium]